MRTQSDGSPLQPCRNTDACRKHVATRQKEGCARICVTGTRGRRPAPARRAATAHPALQKVDTLWGGSSHPRRTPCPSQDIDGVGI